MHDAGVEDWTGDRAARRFLPADRVPARSPRGGERRVGFVRDVALRGWAGATWGYDAVLECYWVELKHGPGDVGTTGSDRTTGRDRTPGRDRTTEVAGPTGRAGVTESRWTGGEGSHVAQEGAVVRIGPEHLITTVTGLARALAEAAGLDDVEAYLALTA